MDDRRQYSRFIVQASAVALGGACLASAFIATVDPYRLYRLIEKPGFNQVKPPPERYREEIKLSNAKVMRANAFIAGNSRAEIGFNPEFATQHSSGLSFYNIALSGTDIATAKRQLQYLREHGQTPAVTILGVEFLDFLAPPPVRSTTAEPISAGHSADHWKWRLDVLFSLTSLTDAFRTLRLQSAQYPESISPSGHNPLLEYQRYAREQGYFALFQQRAVENARSYLDKPRSFLAASKVNGLNDFRSLLDAAIEDKSVMHVVIYPYHAQILAMFDHAGISPLFDEWKRMLAEGIGRASRQHPGQQLVLWDFSGYSPYHCERIPGKNERTETHWYWEAGHFKQQLGHKVLARVLALRGAPQGNDTFGFRLSIENFEENRKRIARERQECEAAYPELFTQARELIDAAVAARKLSAKKTPATSLLAGVSHQPD